MSLVVETGACITGAESYISVADADTYAALHWVSTHAWFTASDGDKEIWLRVATQYLESRFRSQWKGTRKTEAQALAWPRYSVVDEDDYSVDSDSIPQRLRDAQCEVAKRLCEGTDLDPDVDYLSLQKSVTAGPVSVEFRDGPTGKRIEQVEKLLAGLIERQGRVVRC